MLVEGKGVVSPSYSQFLPRNCSRYPWAAPVRCNCCCRICFASEKMLSKKKQLIYSGTNHCSRSTNEDDMQKRAPIVHTALQALFKLVIDSGKASEPWSFIPSQWVITASTNYVTIQTHPGNNPILAFNWCMRRQIIHMQRGKWNGGWHFLILNHPRVLGVEKKNELYLHFCGTYWSKKWDATRALFYSVAHCCCVILLSLQGMCVKKISSIKLLHQLVLQVKRRKHIDSWHAGLR